MNKFLKTNKKIFHNYMSNVKILKNDIYYLNKVNFILKKNKLNLKENDKEIIFSKKKYSNELKKLKLGYYYPEKFIDLHGCTKIKSKKKIEIFLTNCILNKIFCACIIHGNGNNILKKYIPELLNSYNIIIAFCKIPKKIRNNSSGLLILINSYI